jgi:hypothetical protein
MAQNQWRGDSMPVAQSDTITIGGTPAAGNTVTVTSNKKSVTYLVQASDTTATVAAALQVLLNACTFLEFVRADWTYPGSGAVVTATAANPGFPYLFSVSATGGGATITAANVTASAGPNHADDVNNWTAGHTPTGTDDIVIQSGADILFGLADWTVNSVDVRGSFEKGIGNPAWNPAGYYEDLPRFLKLITASVKIGEGAGSGSSALYLGAVASSTWTVFGTGVPISDTLPSLDIKAFGNPTLITVANGSVGLGMTDESVSPTAAAVTMNGDGSTFLLGRTATASAFTQNGGKVSAFGVVTAATVNKGEYTQEDGSLGAIAVNGGYVRLRHTGTVASVTALGQGNGQVDPVVDCTDNSRARVFTNSTFTGGAAFYDDAETVTLTNPAQFDELSLSVSRLGKRFTIQRV